MKRAVFVGLVGLVLSACGASATNPPAGASQPAGGSPPAGQSQPASQSQPPAQSQAPAGSGGGSVLDAAGKVTDVCTLLTAEITAKVIPSAPPPQSQKFPPYMCTYFDGKAELQVTLSPADTGVGGGVPAPGTVPVPGLGAGATVVHPSSDDVYLTVLLTLDQGALYVEINDPSNKDRKDDAIAVAQAVLAALH